MNIINNKQYKEINIRNKHYKKTVLTFFIFAQQNDLSYPKEGTLKVQQSWQTVLRRS